MFDFSSQVLKTPTAGWRLWHSDVHKTLENLEVEAAKRDREKIDVEQRRLVFAKDEQEYDVLRTSGRRLREVQDRKLRALIVHVDDLSAVVDLQKTLRAFITEPEPESVHDTWMRFHNATWLHNATWQLFLYGQSNTRWTSAPNVQMLTGTRISPLGRQLVYGYGHNHTWAIIEDKFQDLEWRLASRMRLDFCNGSRAKSWEHWASKFAQSPLESSQGTTGEEQTWRPRRTTRPPVTSRSASESRMVSRPCWSRGRRRPSISGS